MTTRSRLVPVAVFAAVAALALTGAHGRAASAAAASATARELRLAVTFTPRFAEPLERSEIVGELDLSLLPGDKISGFYRPESDRSAIPVTGGRAAGSTFLDVGDGFQEFHVEGTLSARDGAPPSYAGSARIGNDSYDMSAAPCRDARGALSILCQ